MGTLETVERITFLAKLNGLGRKYLLNDSNTEKAHAKWIDALASCDQDLDAIFAFLSLKPTLCDAGLLDAVRLRRKRRRLT